MREERVVWLEGTPHVVVLSDDNEALLAAQAAGRAVVGILNCGSAETLSAVYLAEHMSAVTDSYLERIVRRHLGLPWIVMETRRLLIREFQAEDARQIPREECAGEADKIFSDERKLADYIRCQYGFYEYGIWAVTEKESGRIIGKAGVSRMEEQKPEEMFSGTGALTIMELPMRKRNGNIFLDKPVLWIELGYHIFEPYRRKGYALEACRGIIEYLNGEYREQAEDIRIYAKTDACNQASVKVLRALGFEPAVVPET